MTWQMTNKYRGKCDRCGKPVAAGAGVLTFVRPSRLNWPGLKGTTGDVGVLEHRECHEKYGDTDIHYLHNPARKNG